MLQLLKNPHFDFMRWGKPLLATSVILMFVSIGILFTRGLNLGIEFTGGTELQVKYADTPDVGGIRAALQQSGLESLVVTTIGDPAEHEVYIRIGTSDAESGGDLTTRVARTLRAEAGGGTVSADRVDLNVVDQKTVQDVLMLAPELTATEAVEVSHRILERRRTEAIFSSMGELADVEGMTPAVMDYLEEKAFVGRLAVRSQSYVGPSIGQELLDKAKLAILLSLIMMLLYIWIRFQLQWGFAAVFALAHDTLITLGLFSLFQKEMSLPVVAAFLTLVGYSVNDTVVVFDRIRENLRNRTASGFEQTINLSINQTLSRTIITSFLTWVVVFGLYLFGGAALNSFAFVLTVGVIVGTYSSIYIASPLLVLWREWTGGSARATAAPARRVARKV